MQRRSPLFAPAKVNLALHVLGRRADGYHDLDSIVAFADVGDWLTFSPARLTSPSRRTAPLPRRLPAGGGQHHRQGLGRRAAIAGGAGLALPPVAVHLAKNLPVASGIGGGSANAAAALQGLPEARRHRCAR